MLKGSSFNEVVAISVFTLYCTDTSKSNISKRQLCLQNYNFVPYSAN